MHFSLYICTSGIKLCVVLFTVSFIETCWFFLTMLFSLAFFSKCLFFTFKGWFQRQLLVNFFSGFCDVISLHCLFLGAF